MDFAPVQCHVDTLRSKYIWLSSKLDANGKDLTDNLWVLKVVSDTDRSRIHGAFQRGNIEGNRQLLDCMRCKSERAFLSFHAELAKVNEDDADVLMRDFNERKRAAEERRSCDRSSLRRSNATISVEEQNRSSLSLPSRYNN